MIEALSHLHLLAVLIASIAHFALGAVWFAALFGRQYALALGIATGTGAANDDHDRCA